MKKLLLVKPHYHHIPIGMAYVLALLEEKGYAFRFVDLSRTKLDIKRELSSGEYYAVSAGGLVSDYMFFHELVRASRAAAPELPIILGGNVTSCLSPDLLFDRLGVDYALRGEAETALPGLLDHLLNESGDPYGFDGPGIVRKDRATGEVVSTRVQALDLQLFDPRPAWHLIDHAFYLQCSKHHAFAPGQTFLPILTGRGCSGSCSFCNPTLGRFRPRRVEAIFEEMRQSAERYDFDVFNFATEVFFARQEEILDFCDRYAEEAPDKPWFCSLRIDVGPDVLAAMKDAGCIGVSIGFESASDRILKSMAKGITAEQGRAFVRATKQLGLPLECNIMVGNEDEQLEDIRASFRMMTDERVDTNVNLTVAYNGTRIFRNAVDRGMVPCEHEQAMNERFVGLYTPDMDHYPYLNISGFSDLKSLHTAIMKEYRAHSATLLDHYASEPVLLMEEDRGVVHWECRSCGKPNDMDNTWRQFDGLVRRRFCKHCHQFSYIRMLPAGVRDEAAGKLAPAQRVVLCGAGYNAQSLWAYPQEGLDMENLLAVASATAIPGGVDSYFFLPRRPMNEALTFMPDLLLSLDRNVDCDISQSLSGVNQGGPDIVHLTPHLFAKGMWAGRRVLFVGGRDPHILPDGYLAEVDVAGVVDAGDPDLDAVLASDRWDVAVLAPDLTGRAPVEDESRRKLLAAACDQGQTSGRPLLHRVLYLTECIGWVPLSGTDLNTLRSA